MSRATKIGKPGLSELQFHPTLLLEDPLIRDNQYKTQSSFVHATSAHVLKILPDDSSDHEFLTIVFAQESIGNQAWFVEPVRWTNPIKKHEQEEMADCTLCVVALAEPLRLAREEATGRRPDMAWSQRQVTAGIRKACKRCGEEPASTSSASQRDVNVGHERQNGSCAGPTQIGPTLV